MPEIKIGAQAASLLLFLLIFEDRASVLTMIVCVLLHECAHILAARSLKIPIKSLHFNMFGARIELGDPLGSYISEFAVAFAGPALNILLGVVGIIIYREQAGDRLLFFTLTNFALAIVNLLPISTLDGGRMLSSLASQFFGSDAAERIMRFVSFAVIVLLWLISVFMWFYFEENISLAVLCMHLFLNLIIKRGY